MKTVLRVPGLIDVYDDVVANPDLYRAAALAQTFGPLVDGDVTFHGLSACDNPLLGELAQRLLQPGARATVSFFRQSPEGQPEPNFIHSDEGMGDWTAILYLNPEPADGDGTAFWQREGRVAGPMDLRAMRDMAGWTRWQLVEARFNRLVIFRGDLYHSRALVENYGTGDEARLIQVVFGRGTLWP